MCRVSPPAPSLTLAEAVAVVEESTPNNWCDPLLTGPNAVLPHNQACPPIEKLLRAVKQRIIAALTAAANGEK
jgi:hypothetical protein